MKFYLLCDPMQPGVFAQFAHVGTWSDGHICKKCGEVVGSDLVEPLQIEWDPGTERIGDFSWCGYTCLVLDGVQRFFSEGGYECKFGRVEVKRPTEKTQRLRVTFPYTGSPLHWLIPLRRVRLNEACSGVKLTKDCPVCGEKRYTFKQEGLVIDSSAASDASLFVIDQFGKSGATFVTESLLDSLKSKGFTNLCPRLAGRVQ